MGLTKVFTVACLLIEDTLGLEKSDDFGASTAYIARMILLAAVTILKIARSQLAPYLDLETGEASYFATINWFRRVSLENDDLLSRSATILSQVWRSTKIFMKSDGTVDGLTLRSRTRLSMSVVFDIFWWWREEFVGINGPYADEHEKQGKAWSAPVCLVVTRIR